MNIRKYIEKIKNFNLFNHFIKKRILSLEHSKKIQEDMIEFLKSKIENNKKECKGFREKILIRKSWISGYKDQLRKLQVIVELYEDK